ncbi:MAG: metallophosphoesterase family protein [Lachnospiraceae bacterium]
MQDTDREEAGNGPCPEGDRQDSVKSAALQVEEQTIIVPGLVGAYRYLFLSDTHIITLNGEETQQQLENALPRRDTLFLDAQGRKPEETFPDWMAYANEQKVDGVLLGGDIIDFPSQSNLDFLEENLGKLEMPVLYVPGNHDWTYPWEYMTEKAKTNI